MNEPKKILVVDDEMDIACLVKARLEANGYEVDMAHKGEDGLTKIKEDPSFDLVVLDVMLPGISGYEVCSQIKADKTLSVPVVMLTARNRDIDEKLGYMCKADAYIRKPMCGEMLLPTIKKLL